MSSDKVMRMLMLTKNDSSHPRDARRLLVQGPAVLPYAGALGQQRCIGLRGQAAAQELVVRYIQAADACKACWYCPCQGIATEAHLCELGELTPAGGHLACISSTTHPKTQVDDAADVAWPCCLAFESS